MVFKTLLKLLKGEGEKIVTKKTNNGIIPPVKDIYLELEVDENDIEEKKDIVRIKVLDLETRKDANEIVVWIENKCIVIANTLDLEKNINEKYLNVIKYLMDETTRIGGKIVRVSNNRIMVLPKNVVIEKAVRDNGNK